jgi:hypothetical protein
VLIEDGMGQGYSVGVNPKNQLLTYSIALDAIDEAANRGESYNVTTDVLTLTNAAIENAILYLQNTNPLQNMNILRLSWSFGKATTTGDVIVRGYINPSAGTIISAGTVITPVQRNLGSRFVAQATVLRMAAVAQTQIGGTLASTRIFQDMTEAEIISGFVVPAGSSCCFTVTPPTGNTSMRCSLTASFFYVDR